MAKNHQFLLKQDLKDLNVIFVGEAECPAGYQTVADSRGGNLLYHVRKGRGTVQIGDQIHRVSKGQYFLILNAQVATLTANKKDPWEYQWIGFTGTLSNDFCQLPTVITLPEEISKRMYKLGDPASNMATRLISDLYLIHGILLAPTPEEPDYVQRVVEYIRSSYMLKLSVSDIAKDFGLDRSYLSRKFSKRMGISIREYLLRIRIAESKRYIKHGYSIAESAQRCGFNDPNYFSKVFTREVGIGPAHWKQKFCTKVLKEQPFT